MQRSILRFADLCVGIFYRRTRLGGEVPAEGPVVLVGNHPNGLVDPVLVAGVTDRPVRFLGKAPLFSMPVLGQLIKGSRALPVYRAEDGAGTADNEGTFRAVFDALSAGDVVCLFPEGKSHTEPVLQKLKTGAARMALGAEARHAFELGVRVVPVGLVYRASRRFRSNVAVWVGAPIDARELAAAHAEDDREAVRDLTARIATGLEEVTLGLDRWEDLPLLELAERIDARFRARPAADADERYRRLRAFAAGLRALRARDPARIDALARRIASFRERLTRLGASLEDLDRAHPPGRVARFVLRTAAMLAFGLPLALLGALLWFPPYLFVPWLTRKLRPTRDVHATFQILGGMLFFPLWALALTITAGLELGWPAAAALFVALPPLGLTALAFLDWRADAWRDVAVFLRLGLGGEARALLAAERDELGREIGALVEELRVA